MRLEALSKAHLLGLVTTNAFILPYISEELTGRGLTRTNGVGSQATETLVVQDLADAAVRTHASPDHSGYLVCPRVTVANLVLSIVYCSFLTVGALAEFFLLPTRYLADISSFDETVFSIGDDSTYIGNGATWLLLLVRLTN